MPENCNDCSKLLASVDTGLRYLAQEVQELKRETKVDIKELRACFEQERRILYKSVPSKFRVTLLESLVYGGVGIVLSLVIVRLINHT